LAELNEALCDAYDEAAGQGELFRAGGTISGHLNCFPGAKAQFIYDDLVRGGIIDLIESVRPTTLDRMRVQANFNLPGSVAQHYHYDAIYTEEFVICNVAVIDTDEINGAIDLLPGTHARFYKFWQYALGRKYKLTTRIPMKAGDVLLRTSRLWHRGMPNKSSTPRPMAALTFGESWADPLDDPFSVNNGSIQFTPNWYSTTRAGALRERAFVTVPISYSAYRFARSLYGNKGYSSWS
jgi:ectoine hydroxylase-related dioxygenase (phytanoyl-CoA dioxygenase family)